MEPLIRCTVLGIAMVTARYFQKGVKIKPLLLKKKSKAPEKCTLMQFLPAQ
tara:strand:- start:214 stop:366 length:153 start_codon:yes stop_codon:yes gene_type:complete